jgi:transcriptional regulator with XRE-family HTH domain
MSRSVHDKSARHNRNKVLDAIADGCTYQQAAKRAGVQVSTVARYMQDDEFTAELQAKRATLATVTSAALTSKCLDAIEQLHSLMNDPRSTQTTKAKAASTLLAEARAWRDADIDERITELENKAQQRNLRAL